MGSGYFCYFMLIGLLMPFLSPVLQEMGYSKQATGLVWGGLALIQTMMPMVAGRISDRYLGATLTIRISVLMMTLLSVWLWVLPHQPAPLLLGLLLALTVFRSPLVALQDTLAMQVAEGNPQSYSRQRLAGSVGFALLVTIWPYLAEGRRISFFFDSLLGITLIFLISTAFMPKAKPREVHEEQGGFWSYLDRGWWPWLLAMMCHWIAFGPFNYGYTLFLEEQGVSSDHTGWYWMAGIVLEVVIFMKAGWFFKRFSVRGLLLLAFCCNLLRWSLMGLFPHPSVLLVCQLFHGPGFALFYAAALQGIREYSGGAHAASFQGLFSTCVGGISSMIGYVAAGWLHQRMSFSLMLLCFVPVQILGCLLLIRFPLQRRKAATGGP